jgi:hypothetical protein
MASQPVLKPLVMANGPILRVIVSLINLDTVECFSIELELT